MKSENVPEPVREVWEWRKLLQKELESLSHEEEVDRINEIARKVCRNYNLKIRPVADKVDGGKKR